VNPVDTVEVVAFRMFDLAAKEMRHVSYKTTRDVVARVRGEALEGTAEQVPRDLLDEQGRYKRIATGWGALD
jgi:hypothetical protein